MPLAKIICWLMLVVVLFALGEVQGAESLGRMRVELLDADLPVSSPAGRDAPLRLLQESGDAAQVTLPFRNAGSWVRITLQTLPKEPLLIVQGMVLDPVTLVLPDGKRLTRSKIYPDDDKLASPMALVFPLSGDLSPATPLYLHFAHQHRPVVNMYLVSGETWHDSERMQLLSAATLCAAVAAFTIVAGCFWAVLRERMFAYYLLYLIAQLCFIAASSGLLYAWHGSRFIARLGMHGPWAMVCAGIGFMLGFVAYFLDIPRYAPRIARILDHAKIVTLSAAVFIVLSPFPLPWFGLIMISIIIALGMIVFCTCIYIARAGNRYAYFFLFGWLPLAFSNWIRALHLGGAVQVSSEFNYLFAFAVIWAALWLTLGIADRVLRVRLERDAAQQAADYDVLTSVLNRRALEMRLSALTGAARHNGAALSLLFLDIDHFKSINDQYGHAAGDLCLTIVAQRISAELRSADSLGRWGGEEFIALLPGASMDNARRTSERIRSHVAEQPVQVGEVAISITISIGIAVFDPVHDDATALARRADMALYRAKANGRNRVEGESDLAQMA